MVSFSCNQDEEMDAMMTKKNFEAVAAAFAKNMVDAPELKAEHALRYLALDLVEVFKKDNPNFKIREFMQACGMA